MNQWYGFSLYYASDWNQLGGLGPRGLGPTGITRSGGAPGANGSLNFSGDMNMNNANGTGLQDVLGSAHDAAPQHGQNHKHFYRDGKGLDKIDLGPIVANRWMDFVCHIRWSTTRHNALRECGRDGQYMGTKRRATR